jgi:CheY-like chemotaxis protein
MRDLVILHVDDVEDDVVLLSEACKSAGLPCDIHSVSDAHTAMQYLAGEEGYSDRSVHPFPDVIILDLTMPGMNGFQFLEWFRQSEFSNVPVMVFTGSDVLEHKERAVAKGVAGFFVKPRDSKLPHASFIS